MRSVGRFPSGSSAADVSSTSSSSRESSKARHTLPVVQVDRHETETSQWEVARRPPSAALRPYLLAAPEGWEQTRGREAQLREVPFPGVPLILGFGSAWEVREP